MSNIVAYVVLFVGVVFIALGAETMLSTKIVTHDYYGQINIIIGILLLFLSNVLSTKKSNQK
jgi:hypothetical protein